MSPPCLIFSFFALTSDNVTSTRLCVSASQDGKLIVWDSITTNKVGKSEGEVYYNDSKWKDGRQMYTCFP